LETRTCIKCGETKDAGEFYAGQGNTCKECVKNKNKVRRRNNPLRYKATRKVRDNDNFHLAITRKKARHKRRYKLSAGRLEQFLVDQDYKCAICRVAIHSPYDPNPPEETAACVVDHDHRDGHVRGLLCSACNTGLGQFEDDVKIIRNAFYYLRNDFANSALR